MIYLWIDAAMLSLMTSSTVVGWYGVPTKLFQSLLVVPVLVSTAWLPRLVTIFERNPSDLKRAARAPLQLVVMAGLPIAALIAAAAGPAIHLVYGSAYDQAVPVMTILGLCIPPMYLNIMLPQVLIAQGRQIVWTWVMAGATVFNPAINAVLIPLTEAHFHNGAIGAALSLLATELLIVFVGLGVIGRGIFSRPIVVRFALTAAASAGMWAVSYLLRGMGPIPALLAGGVTFVLLAIAFRLITAAEVALVRRGLAPIARELGLRCGRARNRLKSAPAR
jgi:O-antigen/teichoic acid export membrane protein